MRSTPKLDLNLEQTKLSFCKVIFLSLLNAADCENAVSEEALLHWGWPRAFPVGTEVGRRADTCQLNLGGQLGLAVPFWGRHERTWSCCFVQVHVSSQLPPLACRTADGFSVMAGLLVEHLLEKEPVSACVRGCWLSLWKESLNWSPCYGSTVFSHQE